MTSLILVNENLGCYFSLQRYLNGSQDAWIFVVATSSKHEGSVLVRSGGYFDGAQAYLLETYFSCWAANTTEASNCALQGPWLRLSWNGRIPLI